jgi:death on curing protein
MAFIWPTLAVVFAVHDEQIAEHGGLAGLRDMGALESALQRPLHHLSFADDPDIAHLAAILAHALAANHPFVDGNKRVSAAITELFLGLNGYELTADDAALVNAWLALAGGDFDEEAMAAWLRANIAKT